MYVCGIFMYAEEYTYGGLRSDDVFLDLFPTLLFWDKSFHWTWSSQFQLGWLATKPQDAVYPASIKAPGNRIQVPVQQTHYFVLHLSRLYFFLEIHCASVTLSKRL